MLIRRLLGGGNPIPPSTDDGLGDKEGDTRRSMECLKLDLLKLKTFFVDPNASFYALKHFDSI